MPWEARTAADPPPAGRFRWRRALAVFGAYVIIGVIYTHPVLLKSATGIANDPYDPILNTSILWWNATTIPFSPGWWNPPHFHPTQGVAAFTENLVGVSLFATPIYWITGSALVAYNVNFVLSWPFCAFTTYLLVWFLVRRHDAAFLAGLAYGFTPYRTAELGHLQMLCVYWFPLTLLGLHGFFEQRRGRWLVLFGVSWVIQVLANGYYLFFGAVVVTAWLLYFCLRSSKWRVLPAILGTWLLANLALLPVMWKYSTIHHQYGLHRTMGEALAFSAPVTGWFQVSAVVWFWHKLLPEGDDNLFPGLTVMLMAAAGVVIAFELARRQLPPVAVRRRWLIVFFASLLTICLAALVLVVFWGPVSGTVLGMPMRITGLTRPANIGLISVLALIWLVEPVRAALARRSTLAFYVAMTLLLGILCCGPQLQRVDGAELGRMPYRWLMYVPGFDSVRVPTRFWMLGALCLAIAAGMSFARYAPSRRGSRQMVFALAIAGILLDGWPRGMGMPPAPQQWPKVERRDRVDAVIELPLGPSWDAAATFRAMRHRRPVVNGVSGYDPPFYAPLQDGLNAFEPSVLVALSAFGPLDIVVNGDADPDGAWARYAASVAGEPILTDGTRRVYHLPATPQPAPVLGPEVPIAAVTASWHGAELTIDGRIDTEWHDAPQQLPKHWIAADLGGVHDVAGVTLVLGEWARDFPRRLAIETSTDGSTWRSAWEGPTVSLAMVAAIDRPREAPLYFNFPSRPARFVRLRTLVAHKNFWRVAELRVHAG